jgi:hypothetical protein
MTTLKSRVALCFLLCAGTIAHAADRAKDAAADKRALAPLQAYVGAWRGVGQLKRGSNQGAWTEASEWAWRFKEGQAELRGTLEHDKFFRLLQLQPGDGPGRFVLLATPADGAGGEDVEPKRFLGKVEDDALVMTADESDPEKPARISMRLVAGGDRMVVLVEKRLGENVYARLAEVGSTRKGSSFAKAVASGPECVVTGGLGTIAVEYMGKTYYVCCGGCRDAFNDDPAGVLEDYRQRKKEEAEKAGDK